jgi:hypothetical protein
MKINFTFNILRDQTRRLEGDETKSISNRLRF